MGNPILKDPIQVLGQFDGGGLGQLLKCRDAKGLVFAAKFPKDHSFQSQQLIVDEERRFYRHQGKFVVQYFGTVNHSDGRRGFAMELMERSLSGRVRAGAVPPLAALYFLIPVAAGLAEVHSSAQGAHHGDVKLANILIKAGYAKLADFGLARGGVGQTQMWGPHTGGTPGYMPPEGYTSAAGDVYSLGVVLWGMLAGREPAPSGPHSITVRTDMAQLVNAMLAPNIGQRLSINDVLQRSHGIKSLLEKEHNRGAIATLAGLGLVGGLAAVLVGALSKK